MNYEVGDTINLIRTQSHKYFVKGKVYTGTVTRTSGYGQISVEQHTYTIEPDSEGISILDFFRVVGETPQSEDDIFRASLL